MCWVLTDWSCPVLSWTSSGGHWLTSSPRSHSSSDAAKIQTSPHQAQSSTDNILSYHSLQLASNWQPSVNMDFHDKILLLYGPDSGTRQSNCNKILHITRKTINLLFLLLSISFMISEMWLHCKTINRDSLDQSHGQSQLTLERKIWLEKFISERVNDATSPAKVCFSLFPRCLHLLPSHLQRPPSLLLLPSTCPGWDILYEEIRA